MIKKIIHLSDLHFGTEKKDAVEALIADCDRLSPDMIIVSGDLTQRATTEQFSDVRNFLDQFKKSRVFCVPGNHDIPLYNLAKRFFMPFAHYKKWISNELCTHYTDDELSVLGINSVTPYKPMSGYVTKKQLKLVEEFFKQQPEHKTKIVVMHHNLISSDRHKIINDSDNILALFASVNVNIVLSGHIHYPCIELTGDSSKNNLYVITAGTPISTRTVAPNSYNYIEIGDKNFSVEVRVFTQGQFVGEGPRNYSISSVL